MSLVISSIGLTILRAAAIAAPQQNRTVRSRATAAMRSVPATSFLNRVLDP